MDEKVLQLLGGEENYDKIMEFVTFKDVAEENTYQDGIMAILDFINGDITMDELFCKDDSDE